MKEYLKSIECLCLRDIRTSGDPLGSGGISANLSVESACIANPSVSATMHSPTSLISGVLGGITEFAPFFSIENLSPEPDPNTQFRIFIENTDLTFAPEVRDTFIIQRDGVNYEYQITSVSRSEIN